MSPRVSHWCVKVGMGSQRYMDLARPFLSSLGPLDSAVFPYISMGVKILSCKLEE